MFQKHLRIGECVPLDLLLEVVPGGSGEQGPQHRVMRLDKVRRCGIKGLQQLNQLRGCHTHLGGIDRCCGSRFGDGGGNRDWFQTGKQRIQLGLRLAQGFVHAQDRFFEMDVRRHATAGRLSELFGKSGLETDLVVRTLGWREVAEKEVAMLRPATRSALSPATHSRWHWLAHALSVIWSGYWTTLRPPLTTIR